MKPNKAKTAVRGGLIPARVISIVRMRTVKATPRGGVRCLQDSTDWARKIQTRRPSVTLLSRNNV